MNITIEENEEYKGLNTSDLITQIHHEHVRSVAFTSGKFHPVFIFQHLAIAWKARELILTNIKKF